MRAPFKGRRMVAIVALFALGTFLAILSVCRPEILAGNTFLASFVSEQIMAFLVIILTVTFASVANIHLQITGMVRQLRTVEARRRAEAELATPLRREINSSAWLLFWAFVVCGVALIAKGQFPKNDYVVSFVHAVGIIVTAINAIVLYDIHKTIFALAPALTPENPNAEKPEDQPPRSPRDRED